MKSLLSTLVRGLTGQSPRQPAPAGPPPTGPHRLHDDYLVWLGWAVPGMLYPGNEYCIDHALRHLPSAAPIVEIGSFCGLSTNLITYLRQKHGVTNRLVTADPWEFQGVEDHHRVGLSQITQREYRRYIKESFVRGAQMFSRGDLPWTVEMLSDDFFAAWAAGQTVTDVFGRTLTLGGPISFCYLDGNHIYDYVRRDFQNCDRFLEPGGFIFFDDSADEGEWLVEEGADPANWTVKQLVHEVQASGRYELVMKNPHYLFRKR